MSMPPPPPGNQPPPGFPPQPPVGPPGYATGGYAPAPAPQGGYAGMAIAGFVLALVGLIPCFWFWFLQIPGYLGVIFSILGLKATKGGMKKGRGLAIAGLVVGLIVTAIALAITAYVYTSDDCVVDGLSFECNIDAFDTID